MTATMPAEPLSATESDEPTTPGVVSPAQRDADNVTAELLPIIEQTIDAFCWQRQGPRVAALGVLGQPFVVEALAAVEKVAAVLALHAPRQWRGMDVVQCVECSRAYPCPTVEAAGGGS